MGNVEQIREAKIFENKEEAEKAIAELGDETLLVETHPNGGCIVEKTVGSERRVLTTGGEFVKRPWS